LETKIKKIEVFISAYCNKRNQKRRLKILLLKRSPHKELYHNILECFGRSVRNNDNFKNGAERQLLEEAGIIAMRWDHGPRSYFNM
jgi:hypothetical protein